MARLVANVLVSHPGTGEPVALLAGTEVPEWAAGMLGAHVLDEAPDEEPDEGDEDPGEGEKPAGNASLDDWRAYALANGKSETDLDGLKRDEIRDLFAE